MAKRISVIVVLLVASLMVYRYTRPAVYRTHLVTHFQRAPSLADKAPVRVDGVTLGLVQQVKVRPELGDQPVKVSFVINAPYDLPIPNDSLVSVSSEGVLGPTVLDVDTHLARGLRIADNGTLKSFEITPDESARAGKALMNAVTQAAEKVVSNANASQKAK